LYVEDLLGSSRGIVQSGQTAPCYDADFSPFGGERVGTNTCAQNYKFEGKERDAETGNDDFGARYYSPVFGRFLSADWSAIPAPVPYANLTNPQTLNLYAMVSDNPESFADLDGHMAFLGECWTDSASCDQSADQSTTANDKTGPPNTGTDQNQAQDKKTVTVTVDRVKSSQPFGHATISVGGDKPVGLVPNSDAKAAAAVVVEAKTGTPVSVPGHIAADSRKPEAQAQIQVTPEQARHMREYIQQAENSQQGYDPGFRNCANFVEEVLRSGGVKAPNDMTPGGLVGDLQKQHQ
jgi:RHS repeat-associated protein